VPHAGPNVVAIQGGYLMTSFIVNVLKKKILVGRSRVIIGKIKYPLRKLIFSSARKNFGLNIVTRRELSSNSEKYHVLQFGSEESIVVSEPNNRSDELPSLIKSKIGTFTLKKPFVSEVPNAELIGSTAVGFDEDGNMIPETVAPNNLKLGLPTRTFILKNLPSFGAPQLDTVCSLWRTNYYNWLVDCLTRIEGLEYYQEQTGRKPVLIINSNPPPWKLESLRLLGYEPDDCVQWNMSRLKVKRLVVPSFRRGGSLLSPTACHWVRQRIFSNLPNVGSKKLSFSSRIYISRPQTVGRQLINEDDVMEALAPFGFVAYTLETMSFSDQVKLFSQAEIVVAPHGAGLTNMIFAQKLAVIELFGSYVVPSFFLLAKALGFQYACLTPNHNGKNQYSEKFGGIMVDIAKLRDLVAEMLYICC
jgi:hypothetical protein